MEETILKEILIEMKGFREDNKSLKSEIEKLRSETSSEFQKSRSEMSSSIENLRSETILESQKLRSELSLGLENLRSETILESQKLRSEMSSSIENLRSETNTGLLNLKSTFDDRLNETNSQLNELKTEFKEFNGHQKGLKTSVDVLQFAINDTRYELIKIKEYLSSRVIWDNDSINIVAESGNVIYGTIKKTEKKPE
ncbi:MAG: hypothetical protein WCS69_02030 [Ignavibacteriaceae bacterium]